MSLALKLPAAGGALDTYMLSGRESWRATPSPAFNRIAYSAAHVVADVRASNVTTALPNSKVTATIVDTCPSRLAVSSKGFTMV